MHGTGAAGMTDWAACTAATWTSFRNLRTHLFRNHVLVVNLMRLRDRICRDVDEVVSVDNSVFQHLLQIDVGGHLLLLFLTTLCLAHPGITVSPFR